MALSSGKYFFSKSAHPPELDDVCDTTKYIDYEKEVQKSYHLSTGGILPAKLPNRTIIFFGGKSSMLRSTTKSSQSSSRSKTKPKNRSKSSKSENEEKEQKPERHATFNLTQEEEKPPEEEKTETIICNTLQEEPLESVSDSDDSLQYSLTQKEKRENKPAENNNNAGEAKFDSDQAPIDEADDEGSFDENSDSSNND